MRVHLRVAARFRDPAPSWRRVLRGKKSSQKKLPFWVLVPNFRGIWDTWKYSRGRNLGENYANNDLEMKRISSPYSKKGFDPIYFPLFQDGCTLHEAVKWCDIARRGLFVHRCISLLCLCICVCLILLTWNVQGTQHETERNNTGKHSCWFRTQMFDVSTPENWLKRRWL